MTIALGSGTIDRMLTAYLDVPVYSEIDGVAVGRAGTQITPGEAQALRDAIRDGRLIVRPSIVVIDELVCELDTDRAGMVRKLRTMRGLGNGFQGMLKQPSGLLRDSIQAYADGAEATNIFLPEDERRAVVAPMAEVCAGSARYDGVLAQVTGDVRGLKEAWRDSMRAAQAHVLAELDWDRRDPEQRRALTFPMFYDAGAADLTEGFAESVGCLEACRRRGIAGLLAVPAVHAFVGVALSQIFAETVGEAGQPGVRLAHRNDGYDLWHAILGSTTEIFVTFDRRLAGHIERVPGMALPRVVRSVTELLPLI